MVFQNYALFPDMNVGTTVAFPLQMRRVPKAEISRRVKRALDLVQLGGSANVCRVSSLADSNSASP